MPRPISRKCIACANLSVAQAQVVHGPDGDGCWDFEHPQRCYSRRNHYRDRADRNAKRKSERLSKTGKTRRRSPKQIVLTPEGLVQPAASRKKPVAAFIVIYRDSEQSPAHAIEFTVWRGSRKIASVKPIHCMGMTPTQIREHTKTVLEQLKQRYQIQTFNSQTTMPVCFCPIEPCPLKPTDA